MVSKYFVVLYWMFSAIASTFAYAEEGRLFSTETLSLQERQSSKISTTLDFEKLDYPTAVELLGNNDKGLVKLDLNTRHLEDKDAEELAEVLKSNSILQSLNLEGNNIGDSGAEALALALRANSALEDLNLARNEIGSIGATAIAVAFWKNSKLRSLDLSTNQIGRDGKEALELALKNGLIVRRVELRGNREDDADSESLLEMIRANSALTMLKKTARDKLRELPEQSNKIAKLEYPEPEQKYEISSREEVEEYSLDRLLSGWNLPPFWPNCPPDAPTLEGWDLVAPENAIPMLIQHPQAAFEETLEKIGKLFEKEGQGDRLLCLAYDYSVFFNREHRNREKVVNFWLRLASDLTKANVKADSTIHPIYPTYYDKWDIKKAKSVMVDGVRRWKSRYSRWPGNSIRKENVERDSSSIVNGKVDYFKLILYDDSRPSRKNTNDSLTSLDKDSTIILLLKKFERRDTLLKEFKCIDFSRYFDSFNADSDNFNGDSYYQACSELISALYSKSSKNLLVDKLLSAFNSSIQQRLLESGESMVLSSKLIDNVSVSNIASKATDGDIETLMGLDLSNYQFS